MAVLALTTVQTDGETRKHPVDSHGKLRFNYFNLPAVEVAGDANTTIKLTILPPGKVRILPFMCRIATSAFGSSRTLDVGYRAYVYADAQNATTYEEAEDVDAFIDGKDVSSAVTNDAWGTAMKYDIYSKGGVTIFATVLGGTIPVGATLSGLVAYLYE